MSTIVWILLVVAVLAVLVGLFAFTRSRQRRGAIMASQPATQNGGVQ